MESNEVASAAVVLNKFGSYDCISITSFPLPNLEDKIEIEVHYCGINFADVYTRQGLMPIEKFPFAMGIECSGIVKAIGSAALACDIKVGQKVVCYDYRGGLHQNVIRINPNKCFLLPDHVDLKDGAAIFVNYLTAYFALFEIGNLKSHSSVFIQSCAGGVGCAATQLAKTIEDVKIVGTCSLSKTDFAMKNGVDFVLPYNNLKNQIAQSTLQGLDLIIDNQSGKMYSELQESLNHLGKIILIGANSVIVNDRKLSIKTFLKLWWNTTNISVQNLIMGNKSVCGLHLGLLVEHQPGRVKEALSKIFDLLKEDKIKPVIDSVWPMADVVSATKQLGERKNMGKVLLEVKHEY